MEFTAENLERAVCQFYQSDTGTQAQAHQWLTAAKISPQAWGFVWELLQPHKATEVQFFGATTLHTKVEKSLNELSPEHVIGLRERLLTTVITYSTGPKIVLNRLCISLSAYLLQTCPEKWSDALPELLLTFTPQHLPQVPADRIIWVLLEILTVLPEELSCMHLGQTQKSLIRHHLEENIPQVLALLEKVLSSNSDFEVMVQGVKCVSSWLALGVPLSQCQNMSSILVALVFNTHKHHIGICEKALEALGAMTSHPDTYKYPTYLLELLSKILPLREIIARELLSGDAADHDLINSLYSLLISFGETHSRLCLDWMKQDGASRDQVLALVTSLLHCSGAHGSYPIDETHSRLTFGFWYILQDEMIASEPADYEMYMKLLGPMYKELVNVLITKAQLHEPHLNVTQEDQELLRCYRQDIGDTMMYCYSILRETTLSLIQTRLQKMNVEEAPWQHLEACLFSLCSIAENVDLEEVTYLPTLFQYIRNLPFQRLDPKVLASALDTIGAYAEWISAHSSTLEFVLPLITIGLNVPETSSSATMALKDLSRDCQYAIKPFSSLILDASQEALHGGRLKLHEGIRLMYSVGRILSILPSATIMQYLDIIITPYLDQLNALSQQQPSTQGKGNILLCLKMVGMLSATLDTRPDSSGDCEGDRTPQPATQPPQQQQQQQQPQPVLLILHKLLPVIKIIAAAWSTDTHVMQAVFSVLKHSVTTLLEDSQPVVTDILDVIVSTFRVCPQPTALDLTRQLCILFGKDDKYEAMLQSLTGELSSGSMARVSSSTNLSEHCELLESLFNLLSNIIKKVPRILGNNSCVDVVSLMQCATVSLGAPESPTVKSASAFLVNLISQSRDLASLSNVVNMCGEQLVHKIVSCIAGEATRSNIETLADILLALNKKYCDNHARWLQQMVNSSVCPRATPQQREQFIKMVLREKANKRKLQETIREFSLYCRGLVATDQAVVEIPFY